MSACCPTDGICRLLRSIEVKDLTLRVVRNFGYCPRLYDDLEFKSDQITVSSLEFSFR